MQHLTRDHCRYWGEPANKPPQGSLVARYGTCPVKMANKNEKSGGFWGLKVVVYKYVLFMYYGIYIFFWFPGWFSPRLTWNKKMNEHVTLQKEFPFPGSMLDLRGVPHGPLLGDVKYVSFASRWRFGRFACRTIGVLTFLLYWLLILFVYVHYLYNVFRTIINVCQKSVVSIIYIYIGFCLCDEPYLFSGISSKNSMPSWQINDGKYLQIHRACGFSHRFPSPKKGKDLLQLNKNVTHWLWFGSSFLNFYWMPIKCYNIHIFYEFPWESSTVAPLGHREAIPCGWSLKVDPKIVSHVSTMKFTKGERTLRFLFGVELWFWAFEFLFVFDLFFIFAVCHLFCSLMGLSLEGFVDEMCFGLLSSDCVVCLTNTKSCLRRNVFRISK